MKHKESQANIELFIEIKNLHKITYDEILRNLQNHTYIDQQNITRSTL